jgi:hypothetical protein
MIQNFRKWYQYKFEAKVISENRRKSHSGVWWIKALNFIEEEFPDEFLENVRYGRMEGWRERGIERKEEAGKEREGERRRSRRMKRRRG